MIQPGKIKDCVCMYIFHNLALRLVLQTQIAQLDMPLSQEEILKQHVRRTIKRGLAPLARPGLKFRSGLKSWPGLKCSL